MTEEQPHGFFEPNFDAGLEKSQRPPIQRGDLIATLVLFGAGAVTVGVTAAAGILMLAIALDGGAGVVVIAPAILFLAGALVALLRMRVRRRAWPVAAIALGAALLAAAIGAIWWATDAGLV